MHFLISSFICCFLLLSGKYATGDQGYQCQQNVPDVAEKALLTAINEERRRLGLNKGDIEYNCDLATKASENLVDVSTLTLGGQSTYDQDWNETLKNAILSNNGGKTNAATKIGCEIKLSTSEKDGSHQVTLNCRVDKPDGKFLR